MKALRHSQMREYFFGHGENALAPSSQTADFSDIHIFRILEGLSLLGPSRTATTNSHTNSTPGNPNAAFLPGDADEHDHETVLYEKITPTAQIQNCLLAITTASHMDKHQVIRDSSVRGYVYVADVDEAKRKIRLLSPQPGQTPANAMVLGSWPEDVPGLVS